MSDTVRCALIALVSCLLVVTGTPPSRAGVELTYLRGALKSPDETGRTFTTQWEYLQELPRPFAFTLSYLNEGHLADPEKHHRDGFVLQAWARGPVLVPWLTLGAGAGPYFWYDTQRPAGHGDEYHRGFGVMTSAAAKVRLPYGGLFLKGQLNWVKVPGNIDTQAMLVGLGTDFSSTDVVYRHLPTITEDNRNEILLLFHNLSRKEVKGVEYRRELGLLDGHTEASVSYLYAYSSKFEDFRSYGAAAQLWFVKTYETRLKFGFGGGLYLDLLESPRDGSGIVSIMIALRLSDHWDVRYIRSRIPPNEDRDEDIRTLAVGLSF